MLKIESVGLRSVKRTGRAGADSVADHFRPAPARDTASVLEVLEVSRRFGKRTALREVSLSVPAQSLCGIVGPNGSGKTTLLNCVVGIDRPDSGAILLDGLLVGTEAAKSRLSYTPDDSPMPDLLTGREFLELVCALEDREPDAAFELAEIFGISDALKTLVGGYSHGMRRRLQFSAAMSSKATVLVMDEPFSGLDVEGTFLLRRALTAWLDSGGSVLMSLHDLASAQRECDHLIVLAAGQVVATGTPAQLMSGQFADLEDMVLTLSGTRREVDERAAQLRAVLCPPGNGWSGT